MAVKHARIPGMDIYGITEARDSLTKIVKGVQNSGLPVEIVRHGKPAVYVMPVCAGTSRAAQELIQQSEGGSEDASEK